MAGIAHEDGRLDLSDGGGLDGYRGAGETLVGVSAAAEGVIHNLTAL